MSGAGERRADIRRSGATTLPEALRLAPNLYVARVINFRIIAGRVRFEIAIDNAERRGLRLSSRLLTVAHFVRVAQQ